ncbi:LysE family translocator [Thalassotalea euphylliae]|uniref:LysE family translocator n=1 Tax=Thalassotalea euphylliae TaxID=1655234 RepID=UPI003630235D
MIEALLTLITATALLLGSPGPAPLALAATGATFGIKRGTPFLFGILLGLACAIVGASAGLAALFAAFPQVRLACQIIGATYMVYVAYKIASAPVNSNVEADRAPSFKDGFILNLLNPKAYAAFLALFSQYLLPFDSSLFGYFATGIICFLVATVVDIVWLCLGSTLRPIFTKPKQAKIVRCTFAIVMVIAVLYALLS